MTSTKLPDHTTMYQALVNKDTNFEGIFSPASRPRAFFADQVNNARKPKPENVEYYTSASEAIRHGYRPCKVCHPMELMDFPPPGSKWLLKEIAADPPSGSNADLLGP
ncbi:MAG: hypothetical protein IPM82_14665 [Saprospiraceae bacterium]|nr:hypothetical protein [Saprospiraceae bacterium]